MKILGRIPESGDCPHCGAALARPAAAVAKTGAEPASVAAPPRLTGELAAAVRALLRVVLEEGGSRFDPWRRSDGPRAQKRLGFFKGEDEPQNGASFFFHSAGLEAAIGPHALGLVRELMRLGVIAPARGGAAAEILRPPSAGHELRLYRVPMAALLRAETILEQGS